MPSRAVRDIPWPWLLPVILMILTAGTARALVLTGMVIDAASGRAIPGATVVNGALTSMTDDEGRFRLDIAPNDALSVRAPGYWRWQSSTAQQTESLTIALVSVRPKALYLSAYGIGSNMLRGQALKLTSETELNALVIDVKGDRGIVPYRSKAVHDAGLEQRFVTVPDMPALVSDLHSRGLYLIARLVTFKDDPFASAHSQWAVHRADHRVWRDREGSTWIDPFQRKAWDRTLALAEEAAGLGFDEIQFDYVRFPDARGLRFSAPNTRSGRVDTINAFLSAARVRLARFNVYISADVFGYVAWNEDDTGIGQDIEQVAAQVDYVCPMLYPSSFTFGIPGHTKPVTAPYEIVSETLRKAIQRTGLPAVRLRPWLQAFRDYAFDHRAFTAKEIRLQINAAQAAETDGWMLWNAHNQYSNAGLRPAAKQESP